MAWTTHVEISSSNNGSDAQDDQIKVSSLAFGVCGLLLFPVILVIAIPNVLPEFIKAAITQQWIDISTGNTNHEVAERMLSLLSLESSESVKHAPCDFDF